jgi:hypothetical protein
MSTRSNKIASHAEIINSIANQSDYRDTDTTNDEDSSVLNSARTSVREAFPEESVKFNYSFKFTVQSTVPRATVTPTKPTEETSPSARLAQLQRTPSKKSFRQPVNPDESPIQIPMSPEEVAELRRSLSMDSLRLGRTMSGSQLRKTETADESNNVQPNQVNEEPIDFMNSPLPLTSDMVVISPTFKRTQSNPLFSPLSARETNITQVHVEYNFKATSPVEERPRFSLSNGNCFGEVIDVANHSADESADAPV